MSRNMKLHEKRDGVPTGFALVGPAPPATVLDLRLALVQSNPAGLEQALYDVSTPSSVNYRKYLTKEEAAQFVSPAAESLAAVNNWLKANNIDTTVLTPAGDWMGFSISVSQANKLFDTEFSTFEHSASCEQSIRTLAYSIPAELQGHLDFVHPTITFPIYLASSSPFSVSTKSTRATVHERQDSCANAVTPACLQALYGIPSTPATEMSNQLAVTGFINEYANLADLATFLEDYRPDMSSATTFSLETLDGGSNPQNFGSAGLEANLDTQYTVGIASYVPITFLSVGSEYHDGLGGFLDAADFFLAADEPPKTVTTSYGFDEGYISSGLANNLCNAYAQLGARGVSLLFSSGDGGVAGTRYGGEPCNRFLPTFPSGCPFVTAVGATEGVGPEIAAPYSSGGFSNIFVGPSYQEVAKLGYVSQIGNTYGGLYNGTGRGYPDVSAQGTNYQIVLNGVVNSVLGTSASTPTFASIIALLNNELALAGEDPLGFLNPWLYGPAASAFNDITSGSNPGCGTDGFPAMAGWNPVTGLGTPNYEKLRAAAGL
ncbi:Tripeptidyl-peptidase sed3 [Sparassis crispa]|uniref:tripeptidyl-peptidase II n=1 Tax=Sparassis crispa TaxID=139825 RepID=A0A401GN86_9APHY|nr:Tripeptidyl-peptidase sed3 [Sparassis crispa]GBE83676.1 Tripeptidyl-peptidase sed3 [Sparassis crispa]